MATPKADIRTELDETIDRLERDLRTALDRSEDAERHRDEILAMAGHELRTPLSALLLHLQAIERAGKVDPSRQFSGQELVDRLKTPISQAKKLHEMLDRLLDTSRVRTATIHLQYEAVDLSLLLGGAVARFEAAAQTAGSRIELAAPDCVIAYVDSFRIEQVLSNLISNAVKYGNGSMISVRLRRDQDNAYIEVEDRGIGIAAADQERVFQRYERATSQHRNASMGLGLYILREIVKAHGGEVGVQSTPGKGSLFTVQLPLRRLPETP